MKRLCYTALTCLLVSVMTLYGQNRPYPQKINYPNCIKPTFDQTVFDYYTSKFYKEKWKADFLKESEKTPNGYYVYSQGTGGSSNTITVSEAHGYGMVIMTLMAGTGSYAEPDAKKYFDGMYAFFRNNPSRLCSEFMSWQVLTGEVSNYNSASDGDLDIAYALILAHYQWGSSGGINYLQGSQRYDHTVGRQASNE